MFNLIPCAAVSGVSLSPFELQDLLSRQTINDVSSLLQAATPVHLEIQLLVPPWAVHEFSQGVGGGGGGVGCKETWGVVNRGDEGPDQNQMAVMPLWWGEMGKRGMCTYIKIC